MHVSFLSSSSLTQSFALRLMCVCGLHLKHQLAILSTHCQVVFRVQTFKGVSLNSPTEEEGFLTCFCGSISTCFFNSSRNFPKISSCAQSAMICSSSLFLFSIFSAMCYQSWEVRGKVVVKCILSLDNDKNWDDTF